MNDRAGNKAALGLLAAIAWGGVLLQLWLSINLSIANGKTAADGIIIFLGYFTVLTNLFVALTATLPLVAGNTALGRWFARPIVLGCAVTSIVIVGITYHLLLRNVWQPQGWQLVADNVLHYAVPILTLIYWIAFPPRAMLSFWAPIAWCLYPAGYFIYVFVRGEWLRSYPYYFIDVTQIGYPQAMRNSFGLLVAFIVLGVIVLAIARIRNRSIQTEA